MSTRRTDDIVEIQQLLFDGFRTRNNVLTAEAQVEASNESLRNTEQNILFNAASSHMDVIRDLKRPKPGPGIRRFDIGNGALLATGRHEITVLIGESTFRIGGGGSTPLSDDALVNLARLAQSRAH